MSDNLTKALWQERKCRDLLFQVEERSENEPHEYMNDLLMVHILAKGNFVGFVVKVF